MANSLPEIRVTEAADVQEHAERYSSKREREGVDG